MANVSIQAGTTTIERGTGERIECQRNGTTVCAGQNASGKKLLDRTARIAHDLVHAARRLTGSDPPRRPLDGTVTLADMLAVSAVIKRLPVQLALEQATDRRTILFVFLRENPSQAVLEAANDPSGFANLANDVRRGRFGAGALIDAPFPTVLVVGLALSLGVVGGAVYLARR